MSTIRTRVTKALTWKIIAAIGFVVFSFPNARAQLGEMQVNGLAINVRGIYLSGDTRDLDCSVNVQFRGPKFSEEVHLGKIQVLRAVDDSGNNLIRANGARQHIPAVLGNSQLIWLMNPSARAKSISIEGEVEVFTPTIPPPVITNFTSRSGGVLQHPVLDEYHIKLKRIDRKGAPANEVELQLEDPQGKFRKFDFLYIDGSMPMMTFKGASSFGLKATNYVYSIGNLPLQNLCVMVRVEVPETSEKVRFKLEKIRLPWIEPQQLELRVANVQKWPGYRGWFAYGVYLSFAGGPMTNAIGIRKLSINKIEGETNQTLELDPLWINTFTERQKSDQGPGRAATCFVQLRSASAEQGKMKLLAGDAEVFHPTINNGGIVELNNVFAAPGQAVNHPVLRANGVVVAFLSEQNYLTKSEEFWRSPGGAVVSGGSYDKPRKDIKDSLMFLVDDPDKRIVDVSNFKMNFLDDQGNVVVPIASAQNGKRFLYAFDRLPRSGRVRFYVATPESILRVPFKVENVLLPPQ